RATFKPNPTKNPGTVIQFGMRLQRRSVYAATNDSRTAPARIAALKAASASAHVRLRSTRYFLVRRNVCLQNPLADSLGHACGRDGWLRPPSPMASKDGLLRGFSHRERAKSMRR